MNHTHRKLANPEHVDQPAKAQRQPVDERWDILNPFFLKWMARLAHYGVEKYGDFNYIRGRLVGDRSPINHIQKHLAEYVSGTPYDHFDGDRRWHLVAIAYNAMMEFFSHSKWGWLRHPLQTEDRGDFNAPEQKDVA